MEEVDKMRFKRIHKYELFMMSILFICLTGQRWYQSFDEHHHAAEEDL